MSPAAIAFGWEAGQAIVLPSPPSRIVRTGSYHWLADRTLGEDSRQAWNANYGGANEATVIANHKALLDAILTWLAGTNVGLNILINGTNDATARPFVGAVHTYLTVDLGNTVTWTDDNTYDGWDLSPYDLIMEQYDPGATGSKALRDTAIAAGMPMFSPSNQYDSTGIREYGCDADGTQTWSEPPTYPNYQRDFDWLGTTYWCTAVNAYKVKTYTQTIPGTMNFYEDSIGQKVLFTWERT